MRRTCLRPYFPRAPSLAPSLSCAMHDPVPGTASEFSFPIEYQEFAGARYNLDLRGKGTLVVREPGPDATFVFSGDQRRVFSFRRKIELTFHANQMWNVFADGRAVRFDTTLGKSGAKKIPFVFFCRTPEVAAAVIQHLPQTRDHDFFAAQDFLTRLQEISGPDNPWSSITNIIVGLNLAVFVMMGFLGAGWIDHANMMPYIHYGANNGAATTDGEWWRLVTSMFMHYGIIHLALNMWALFQAGHLAEKLLGRWPYAFLYLGSGIVGSLTTIAWNGDQKWSAGASGAVFGVYGALLGYMLREKHGLPAKVYQPLVRSTLSFAGYNLVFGLIHPSIDNAAHLGGLISGAVLGWILALPVQAEIRAKFGRPRLLLGVAVLSVVVAVGVATAPRFDYHVREELAWEETNRAPMAREAQILRSQEAALQAYDAKTGTKDLRQWLTQEGLPFYENWSRAADALPLDPQRATALRRERLAKILQLRITSYRHLVEALQRDDPRAVETFREEEQQVIAKIRQLSPPK